MSHWMTSGASRLKARQNRKFEARLKQRAAVVAPNNVLLVSTDQEGFSKCKKRRTANTLSKRRQRFKSSGIITRNSAKESMPAFMSSSYAGEEITNSPPTPLLTSIQLTRSSFKRSRRIRGFSTPPVAQLHKPISLSKLLLDRNNQKQDQGLKIIRRKDRSLSLTNIENYAFRNFKDIALKPDSTTEPFTANDTQFFFPDSVVPLACGLMGEKDLLTTDCSIPSDRTGTDKEMRFSTSCDASSITVQHIKSDSLNLDNQCNLEMSVEISGEVQNKVEVYRGIELFQNRKQTTSNDHYGTQPFRTQDSLSASVPATKFLGETCHGLTGDCIAVDANHWQQTGIRFFNNGKEVDNAGIPVSITVSSNVSTWKESLQENRAHEECEAGFDRSCASIHRTGHHSLTDPHLQPSSSITQHRRSFAQKETSKFEVPKRGFMTEKWSTRQSYRNNMCRNQSKLSPPHLRVDPGVSSYRDERQQNSVPASAPVNQSPTQQMSPIFVAVQHSSSRAGHDRKNFTNGTGRELHGTGASTNLPSFLSTATGNLTSCERQTGTKHSSKEPVASCKSVRLRALDDVRESSKACTTGMQMHVLVQKHLSKPKKNEKRVCTMAKPTYGVPNNRSLHGSLRRTSGPHSDLLAELFGE